MSVVVRGSAERYLDNLYYREDDEQALTKYLIKTGIRKPEPVS